MAVNLTGIVGDVSSLIPSSTDILQQVIIGAGASVVLAGLKTNAGMDSVDPLHIFHHPATATAPATTSTLVGKTIPVSAFNALDANGKQQILAMNYSIIPG